MTYKRKSWQQKMEDKKDLPKILRLQESFPCFKPAQKLGAKEGDECVLVNPREVEEIMRGVPEGKLITIYGILKRLALKYEVPAACSLTTGIFIMTSAHAAEERIREGKAGLTPYWRTLKADGFLNEKFPGGAEAHKRLLEEEGFTVLARGKRYRVKDFENYLV